MLNTMTCLNLQEPAPVSKRINFAPHRPQVHEHFCFAAKRRRRRRRRHRRKRTGRKARRIIFAFARTGILRVATYKFTPLHRAQGTKRREKKERGKSREKKSEIPIRPGGLKFFRDVLAAARNRNAGCSRQGGGKRGDEIAGRAKSRPLYVSGAIRGLVFSRDPFRTLRPPSTSRSDPPQRSFLPPEATCKQDLQNNHQPERDRRRASHRRACVRAK